MFAVLGASGNIRRVIEKRPSIIFGLLQIVTHLGVLGGIGKLLKIATRLFLFGNVGGPTTAAGMDTE